MAEDANILVVSDLHFGEELLPGATSDRRHAVELGEQAFKDFLAHHASRRLGGRPWRLVIAGDLFDFMSVFVPGVPGAPGRTADERRFGLSRTIEAGVYRLQRICENHRSLLAAMVKFAAAGHSIDIIAGNHDIELLEAPVVDELERQLRISATSGPSSVTPNGGSLAVGQLDAALSRIRVVPWFVLVPGVAGSSTATSTTRDARSSTTSARSIRAPGR
jgi:hypothetical protein